MSQPSWTKRFGVLGDIPSPAEEARALDERTRVAVGQWSYRDGGVYALAVAVVGKPGTEADRVACELRRGLYAYVENALREARS